MTINPNLQCGDYDDQTLPMWIVDATPFQLAHIRKIHVEIVCSEEDLSEMDQKLIAYVVEKLAEFQTLKTLKVTVIRRDGASSEIVAEVESFFSELYPTASISSCKEEESWQD